MPASAADIPPTAHQRVRVTTSSAVSASTASRPTQTVTAQPSR